MKELLATFENNAPVITIEWHDRETEAKGWVVINSLRGGAAGGGTRMRKGLTRHEVLSLAKTMEVKFTVSGPSIGGAKSGIDFDPSDPRKKEVLERWFKAISPVLKSYYGTGGDLNVDEIHEVIPMTKNLEILHPQEGVLIGHFNPSEENKSKKIKQLQDGVLQLVTTPKLSPRVQNNYTVADMITGYGVAEAVKHYYDIYTSEKLENKKAIVQGWGNVAAAAAFYLSEEGVKIVGIIDRDGGLINTEGLSHQEIVQLFLDKEVNKIKASNLLDFNTVNEKIWDVPADIFIPAAASRLVTQEQIDRLIKGGLEVISCGANVPFADKEIFFGPISKYTDEKVSVLPDFIANCGMARVFAYLMQDNADLSDVAIFEDTSKVIKQALETTYQKNNSVKGIAQTAFEIALKKLI